MMNKNKGEIVGGILFLLFGLLLITDMEEVGKGIVGIIFAIVFWSFNIYEKLEYKNQPPINLLRIPTQNDSFDKTTSIAIGGFVLAWAIIFLFLLDEFSIYPLVGVVVGILVLTNGILDIPKGIISVEGFDLQLPNLKKTIDIRVLESIEVYPDKLNLIDVDKQSIMSQQLKLDEPWLHEIETFLQNNFEEHKIHIINKL